MDPDANEIRHSRQDKPGAESAAELVNRLRAFRDLLPDDQRRAFNHILAGAGATFRAAPHLRKSSNDGSVASAIAALRKDLPGEQREGLDAILLASAFAWGVQAGRGAAGVGVDGTPPPPSENGDQHVAFAHVEAIIRLAVGAAVVATAIIEGIRGMEDEEEPLVIDITDVLD